jgi:hypothetical protein
MTTATTAKNKAKTAKKPVAVTPEREHYTLFDGRTGTAMFQVEATHLRCVLGAVGKGDVREYINGLYLDLGVNRDDYESAQLVATNGHIICRCPVHIDRERHWPVLQEFVEYRRNMAKEQDIQNPDDLIISVPKAPTAHQGLISFDLAQGAYWSKSKQKDWALKLIDGRYPEWRRVDPWYKPDFVPEDSARPIVFNFKYVNAMFPDDAYVIITPSRFAQGAARLEPNSPELEGVYGAIMEAREKSR